jgi:hypothetical protein
VLSGAGATRPKRDAVDERVVKMVRTGHVTAKATKDLSEELERVRFSPRLIRGIEESVQAGIISDIGQVGGYPEYRGQPYADADSDGIPDEWELNHGLDPKNAADAATDLNGDGYTNIEDFLNGQDPAAKGVEWKSPRTYKDLFEDASS